MYNRLPPSVIIMTNISVLERTFPEYCLHTNKNITFGVSLFLFFFPPSLPTTLPFSRRPLSFLFLSSLFLSVLFLLSLLLDSEIYRYPPFIFCPLRLFLLFSLPLLTSFPFFFYSVPFSRLWPTQLCI
jgi:hypothetical protein